MWLVHGNGPTEPQLQVVITGGWCVAKKKGTYIYRGHHLPWRKKREKKEEVPSTGIELANFDFLVWWCHPLRHSGINWEITFNFSKLTPTRRSLVPHTKTKTIFPHQIQVWPCDLCMVMAQQSPSCRWWSQVGGVLQRKKEHTEDTTSHGGKKKGKKKREKKRRGADYGYRTRELRVDSLTVSPPTPQRH